MMKPITSMTIKNVSASLLVNVAEKKAVVIEMDRDNNAIEKFKAGKAAVKAS